MKANIQSIKNELEQRNAKTRESIRLDIAHRRYALVNLCDYLGIEPV